VFRLRPAFSGGIVLPARAPRPGDASIRQLPFAPLLYLPLRQHAGRPAAAVLREGDEVARGQLLAAADGATSVPLHAPATGRIIGIVERADPAGGTVQVIQLEPFPGDTQEYPAGPARDPEIAGAAGAVAIIDALRDAGVVGMGGEARPAYARLAAACEQGTAMLVINGIEVEHVFSRVPAILREHGHDVLTGVRFLLAALGAAGKGARAVLAVEQQDGAAAQSLVAAAPAGLPLTLRVLPPRYPQGAEELLLRVLSDGAAKDGGPAPNGASPDRQSHPGALCFNVATVAEIGRLLAQGQSVTDQVVTLAGGALREPGNYRVPLGTPLGFALAEAGLLAAPARVLEGGPMRGEALASLEKPITKGMTGFVALDRQEAGALEAPMPCIRCGECVAACPIQLHPAELGLLARKGDLKAMHEEYHLDYCFECGCCAYVCPSRIPLVQVFRAAKAQWRRRQPAPVEEGA
jgi:Na+-translocating ferredoxin:NAD+ oxidoreductase subunit C